MRHSPYEPPILQNGTAGHALHDVAGLLQQALVRDPQHHTALGGEDWRVTSTISMAYSCMVGAVCCLFWVLSWFKRLFPLCIARKPCLQKEAF